MRDIQDHRKDADCTIDPETKTCIACGAEHGHPCAECEGRAYHEAGCSEAEEGITEREFERALVATLSEAPDDYKSDEALDVEKVKRVETFETVGMLTRDRGLVVSMKDGSEFQITIVKSK